MAKKKKSYSKVIVSFVIAANTVFTGAVLWVFLRTSAEPVALIGAWFAFTTAEVWQLATIKKKKIDRESANNG